MVRHPLCVAPALRAANPAPAVRHRLRQAVAVLLPAAVVLSLATPAGAESLRVTVSGVFTPETPTLAFSAPGAAWSMSFVVDRRPQPIGVGVLTQPGAFVTVPFSDFRLLVNGVEVAPATQVTFYAGPNDGGMDVFFSPVDPGVTDYQSIGALGAAYYSGSELAPRFETGSYPTLNPASTGLYVVDFDDKYWQPAGVVTISVVPEPAAWAPMLGGLGLLLARRSVSGTRPRAATSSPPTFRPR
jgi:hypothetical protein